MRQTYFADEIKMANQALILEVGDSGFDKYVIQNSHLAPVLVEFMAMWSGPCIAMSNVLHELADEFAGQFVFAKVDMVQIFIDIGEIEQARNLFDFAE